MLEHSTKKHGAKARIIRLDRAVRSLSKLGNKRRVEDEWAGRVAGEGGRLTVYVSPFTNSTNSYIELQKQILEELGFEVKPFSLKHLATGGLMAQFAGSAQAKSRPVVALHWLETRLFPRQGSGVAWSWKGAAEFATYLVLMKALRCHTVYFVHNHAVHDGNPWQRAASKWAIRLLRDWADARIVHDPSYCSDYQATYLPHPLYWDAPPARASGASRAEPPVAHDAHSAAARDCSHLPVRFGILGAIRPYKRIDDVLRAWPKEERLMIRGKGDPDYVLRLQDIVKSRELTGVDVVNRFLTDAEVHETLRSWDVVILPQMTDSMLVSGAFFEAVGVAPAVILRDSPFARWCGRHIPGVWTFEDAAQLPELVRLVSERVRSGTRQHDDVSTEALRLFGWGACLERYGSFWRESVARAGQPRAAQGVAFDGGMGE